MNRIASSEVTREGFLLSRQWRDARDGLRLELWVSGNPEPLHITLTGQKAVFFVEREQSSQAGQRRSVALSSMEGKPVDALYFDTQRELVAERSRLQGEAVRCLEADVKPVERYLMERFILGGIEATGAAVNEDGVLHMTNPRLQRSDYRPKLRTLSVDIETDGFDGPLLSIAGASREEEHVFLVGGYANIPEHGIPGVSVHPDEGSTLHAFVEWVRRLDPDLIVGWSVIEFDLNYLCRLSKKLNQRFELGRARGQCEVLAPMSEGQPYVARVPGRVVLDGIATLRSATYQFESFALQEVAQQLLGRGKKIRHDADPVEEIRRMAAEDPRALAEYNLEDCRLVLDIFDAARLVEFAIERQRLTGLPLDRQGGSVAAFDQLYLPRLHRAGFVAPSVGNSTSMQASPGGYVLDSRPGLYRNVLVLDFKSLYPSIIRTFLIDPLGLARGQDSPDADTVPGYGGARFAREGHILPELTRNLWQARDQAKRDSNAALSQAIKIMMNSFYGVLGTPGCRFFDSRLATSITRRGHDIIQRTVHFIEQRDLSVIYGDTDSVFVHLDESLSPEQCNRIGAQLARDLTEYFRQSLRDDLGIESYLELEFETHFTRFLMPTMRGSETGTKKRYAGAVLEASGETKLVFKGLEAVRTDWTPAARSFQRELFRRAFDDAPLEPFVREMATRLRSGQLDEQLVYRKRLRRHVDDYTHNVPPHVQAARQLPAPGRFVSYVITTSGPQPVQAVSAPLDYEHYLDRQLAPAADSLLHFLGTSFAQLTDAQLELF